MNSAPKKGFTLIELLVVISILALLSAVGVTIYQGAVKKGRITKRIEDLRAIKTALEIYNARNNSYPPTPGNGWRSECNAWGPYAPDQVIPNFIPTYMQALPSDPSMNKAGNTSCYIYRSDGIDYKLIDENVSEISLADMQAQRSLWDLVHPSHPNHSLCGGADAGRSFAVWTSTNSQCW